MIIMVHADAGRENIEARLGTPQYSYYFAMREFLPVLDRLGILVQLQAPAAEADGVHGFARQIGERAVFLSFAPPHLTEPALACPTAAVFPVEYHDLPAERWNGVDRNDWRWVLRRLGRAVTHSGHAGAAVRRALGPDFPVSVIPSPLWDRCARLARSDPRPEIAPFELAVRGDVVDSRVWQPVRRGEAQALSASAVVTLSADPARARRRARRRAEVRIAGIVYTTIFNPRDGRKNWHDIVRAFCLALRDHADATLVLKLVCRDASDFRDRLIQELQKLAPFDCRVVMIDAFLDEQSYGALIGNASYAVNASAGEGQCLPLMEAMSAGVPAIAPPHTAMADYVDAANAFLVGSTLEPAAWPHDPLQKLRTTRHRIDAGSLAAAFRESYRVAKQDPARWRAMARQATARLQRHCSAAVVEERLRPVLAGLAAAQPPPGKKAR
jgi:glycosyltransferase involved in cell wall biosynthesis